MDELQEYLIRLLGEFHEAEDAGADRHHRLVSLMFRGRRYVITIEEDDE